MNARHLRSIGGGYAEVGPPCCCMYLRSFNYSNRVADPVLHVQLDINIALFSLYTHSVTVDASPENEAVRGVREAV